ncbi:hypothetical protein Vadar_027715 [Vaccinium darrowii]|nr:hypothetical protein Vadar_027715 [Vaccinium darrowii]
MSSSSNTAQKQTLDLRFVPAYCRCRRKMALKIVDSDKPTKGMLYYACEQKPPCGDWAWCNPVSVTWQPSAEAVTYAGRFGQPMNEQMYEETAENEYEMARPRVVMTGTNADKKWMKRVVFVTLIVSIFSMFVTMVTLLGK